MNGKEFERFNGNVVVKNFVKAKKLCGKASDAGNASAMIKLGRYYEYGKGVIKDLDEAERWYRKAMELDPALKEDVETALKRMGRL